jgi:hypothetical protein
MSEDNALDRIKRLGTGISFIPLGIRELQDKLVIGAIRE